MKQQQMKLAREITADEVNAYNQAGVVHLRGVLDLATVNLIRRNIDNCVATIHTSPSGYDFTALTEAFEADDQTFLASVDGGQHPIVAVADHVRASGCPLLFDEVGAGHKGHFFLDTAVTSRNKELRSFALRGAAAEIAGCLIGGNTVRYCQDQIFVKEPGTREKTAFHQDATYLEIDGDQCCVLWIPVDPAIAETAGMEYIRGSHRDGKLYKPNVFVAQTPLPYSEGEDIPDIEGNRQNFDIVSFDAEPGDIIVHHYKTIHGSRGNMSRYQVRRALTVRYAGDDIRVKLRPWAPRQMHLKEAMVDGGCLGDVDFPIVWQRKPCAQAA
ncbi:MAG: phytanoyl-CoA dioxygenase family protein [Hyphomicrobiaceae bacterium]|nr:phytanoyl-CoA dioxygenase family protein [Hyphomicrobiaceae bacterium]